MSASFEAISTRIGEIIETSTSEYWVECDEIDHPPPFGAVVRATCRNDDIALAVIANTVTAGVDESRRAVRRGSPEVQDEAVYQRHPELGRILRTVFQAMPIGYFRSGRLRAVLPPAPPPLHFSVAEANDREIAELGADGRHLRLLIGSSDGMSGDQLIIAHVRYMQQRMGDDAAWSERAAREIARLLRHDYARLVPILEEIDPARI